jgi:hypothetical protein
MLLLSPQILMWRVGGGMMLQPHLGVKCEDETHTPKSGNLESFGTLENSELEFRSQNTSN